MKKYSSILKVMAGIFLISVICNFSYSNNVQVANVTLTGQNASEDFTFVQFDLSWENSWHISDELHEFWDASWIFVKYRIGNSDQWEHATLDNSTVVAPTGCTVDVTSDGKGAFFYRSEPGEGNNNWIGIQLKWLYGTDGLPDNAVVDVKVFAIEMVYVPEGSFWVGDGSGIYTLHDAGDINTPFLITSEDQLTLGGNTPGNLTSSMFGSNNDFYESNYQCYLSANFPKGYRAFYCMKYETSEGQYVDFLNCLTRTQQKLHVRSDISGDVIPDFYVMCEYPHSWNRSTIHCPEIDNGTTSPVIFTTDAPDRACTHTNNPDVLAYLDWSALRPMTCLEYEKACRGANVPPVPGDFAWGTSVIHKSNISLINIDTPDEMFLYSLDPVSGDDFTNSNRDLFFYGVNKGPFRCGIFASSAPVKNRVQTGGTFYGIMEMSGNLYGRAVPIENLQGRLFNGAHGDGHLDTNGNEDVASWNNSSYTFLFSTGYSYHTDGPFSVSYRRGSITLSSGFGYGFRGVRTAE